MRRTLKRIGSVLLVLCMICMLCPVQTFAYNDEDDVYVVITDEGDEISVKIDDVVQASAPNGDTITSVIVTDDGTDVDITVNGENYTFADDYDEDAGTYADASVLVNDSVEGSGVTASSSGDYGWTDLTVIGDVVSNGVGVNAENTGECGWTSVSVSSKVSGDTTGIMLTNNGEDNDSYLEIGGTVTGGTDGLVVTNEGEASSVVAQIDGDVIGTEGIGIQAVTTDTGSYQFETGDTYVGATGSVKGGDTGVVLKSENGTSVVTVNENISGGKNGVEATATDCDEVTVWAGGSISGESGVGVSAKADNSFVQIIAEEGVKGGTIGISIEGNQKSYILAVAGGDITGETGIQIDNQDSYVLAGTADITEGPTTSAENLYNVTATTTGIEINQSENDGCLTQIIIDGVLKVADGGTPILLSDTVTETAAGNINVVVWKIEGQPEDGALVSGGTGNAAAALQSSINYIIKIADDADSQTVFGGNYENGDTFNEGEREIEVTVPDGFELTAYATEGTAVSIVKNADGKYIATIPAGGGIYLHAVLTKISAEAAEPEKPEEKAADSAQAFGQFVKRLLVIYDKDKKVKLTFMSNGTYAASLENGKTEKGTFKFEDGKIVLVDSRGTVMPISEDGELSFASASDASQIYQFQFSEAELDLLRNAL